MRDFFHIKIRASLAVESAVLLPAVVILFALFLSAFKTTIGYMRVERALLDTVRELSGYSYLYEAFGLSAFSEVSSKEEKEVGPKLKQAAYQLAINSAAGMVAGQMMTDKLSDVDLEVYGIRGGARSLSFWGTKAFYARGSHKALITIKVTYQPVLLDGGDFLPLNKVTLSASSHAFLGDDPFQNAEPQQETVYQIGDGQKYHSLDCFLIDKTITELYLWEATGAGYSACSYCDPWERDKVYISSGGLKYHTDTCPHLYPDLTALSLKEATEKGLEPCGLCQSDEEYFTH